MVSSRCPRPSALIRSLPIEGTPVEWLVGETRQRIRQILHGRDDRLLVVIGPCSIHDPDAALEYARRLADQRRRHAADLEIVMRAYLEKPRTTVGWKGLINDPYLDGSCRIGDGLRIARDLLVRINRAGTPAATEFLGTLSPHYIGDLIGWGAIGARTTESQVHRELASGLPIPIGFKNGTDGNVKVAVAAIRAARERHHCLAIGGTGRVAIVETPGNDDCHIVLRGGNQPNYDARSVAAACGELAAAGLRERLVIDFSHANSRKDQRRQLEVGADVATQLARGERRIAGVMIESHLQDGRQDIVAGKPLAYGQSVTDACIGWDSSVALLETLASAVRRRREIGRRAAPSARPDRTFAELAAPASLPDGEVSGRGASMPELGG
jgi:3-deoxy-7-phosphoheptulonate synthase